MKTWSHYYARGIALGWDPMYAAWAADRQAEGRSIASLSKLRKELQRQATSGDEQRVARGLDPDGGFDGPTGAD